MSTDAQPYALILRWLCRFSMLAALWLPLHAAYAATFPDLYTVTVELDPQAENRRDDAVRRGMEILLTRVTGRTNAAVYPDLGQLLETAPRLVTSYGQIDNDSVRVGFNAAAVQSALAALDWPLWGAERPQLVLWAAIDFGNGERDLIAAPAADAPPRSSGLSPVSARLGEGIVEELVRAADRRGLPLRLPRMDEEDSSYASYAAVWGGFSPLLLRASARYRADFVLLAQIRLTDFGLEIEWELTGADGSSQRLLTSAPREGIDWVADQFAARFASAGGLRQTSIEVEGIDSLATYGRVMRYLETLSIIESVDVAAFSGQALSLVAEVRGDAAVLDRVFELGGILRPADSVPFGGGFGTARRFRLVDSDAVQ